PRWFASRSEAGTLVRYTYRPRLPAAFLIGKAWRVDSATAVSAGRGKIRFDPTRSALVEGRCTPCASMTTRGMAGVVLNTRWDSGSVTATVDAARPSLLVLSQSWFPGWTASVD